MVVFSIAQKKPVFLFFLVLDNVNFFQFPSFKLVKHFFSIMYHLFSNCDYICSY